MTTNADAIENAKFMNDMQDRAAWEAIEPDDEREDLRAEFPRLSVTRCTVCGCRGGHTGNCPEMD